MTEQLSWIEEGPELERFRQASLTQNHNTRKDIRSHRDMYGEEDLDSPLNGFVEYNGEVTCISCVYGWLYEFGAIEPENYTRYDGCCYMLCSQCGIIVQPWKEAVKLVTKEGYGVGTVYLDELEG